MVKNTLQAFRDNYRFVFNDSFSLFIYILLLYRLLNPVALLTAFTI